MTVLLVLAVAVAGGIGSGLRYLTDNALPRSVTWSFPWGTVVINLAGSFLLGIVTGAASHWLTPHWAIILSTGLLGGYTTFSTASLETVRLLRDERWGAGLLNGLGMLLGCVALASLGLILGSV